MSSLALPLSGDSSETRERFRLGYRPELDGLRAVSIVLVLVLHLNLLLELPVSIVSGGFLGVDIFFVISGFLITSLLLEEHSATETISLRQFYIRRAMRLLPALVVVLIFSILASFIINTGLTPLRLASTVAYFTNWVRAFEPPRLWFLSHFWSLSIEEQFYILWPPFLLALLYSGFKGRTIALLLCGMIWGSAFLRAWLYLEGVSVSRLYHGSDTRADALLIGCLIAFLVRVGGVPSRKTISHLSNAGLVIMGAFVLIASDHFAPLYLGGFTLFSTAAGLLILRLTLWPSGTHSVLRQPLILWIGRRSYGLYLWHWPMYEVSRAMLGKQLITPAIGLVLTFAVAALSYRFVELPFLQMKPRFSRPREASPVVS